MVAWNIFNVYAFFVTRTYLTFDYNPRTCIISILGAAMPCLLASQFGYSKSQIHTRTDTCTSYTDFIKHTRIEAHEYILYIYYIYMYIFVYICIYIYVYIHYSCFFSETSYLYLRTHWNAVQQRCPKYLSFFMEYPNQIPQDKLFSVSERW